MAPLPDSASSARPALLDSATPCSKAEIDEDLSDVEDWKSLGVQALHRSVYDASQEVVGGTCKEEGDREDLICCDGGYCRDSWYQCSCVDLDVAPISGKS